MSDLTETEAAEFDRRLRMIAELFSAHRTSPAAIECHDPLFLIDRPWLNPKDALTVTAAQGTDVIYMDPEYPIRMFWEQNADECEKGSLNPLASLFKKDARTIRRYCESGVIPGRYTLKTAGGHWRINYNAIETGDYYAIKRAIDGQSARSEKPKSGGFVDPLTARAYIAEAHHLAVNENGALKPEEVQADVLTGEATPESFNEFARQKSALIAAAFHLRRDGEKPTAKRLAEKLGISRATLYNRFTKSEIAAAILASGVKRSLGSEESDMSHFDADNPSGLYAEIDARLNASA